MEEIQTPEGCVAQMALLIMRCNPIYWVVVASAIDVKKKGFSD